MSMIRLWIAASKLSPFLPFHDSIEIAWDRSRPQSLAVVSFGHVAEIYVVDVCKGIAH